MTALNVGRRNQGRGILAGRRTAQQVVVEPSIAAAALHMTQMHESRVTLRDDAGY
jgi:hypothetical protein